MAHPKNKYERVHAEKLGRRAIKEISTYGYKPYVGWAVVPKEMADELSVRGQRFWARGATLTENEGKPYYIQYVSGGMARRRKYYKTRANRHFRRMKNSATGTSEKSGYKRHYDVDWEII